MSEVINSHDEGHAAFCLLSCSRPPAPARLQEKWRWDLKIRNTQDAIRLIIVLLYFLFLLPGILVGNKYRGTDFASSIGFTTILSVGALFLLLELLEFFRWSYEYDTPLIPRVLFFLRLVLLTIPVSITLIYTGSVAESHGLSLILVYAGLMPYYAYYAFPKAISLPLLIAVVVLPPLTTTPPPPPEGVDGNLLGIIMYRTLSVIFFYLLAWLTDMERRRDRENRLLVKKLTESESRIRDFAERVGQVVALEERTRLARDIHDSLGHALTAIKIQLSKAEAYQSVNPDESAAAVKAAKETADDAMKDIRESLGRLNGDGAAVSLAEALPVLAKRMEDAGLEVEYTYSGSEDGYNYSVLMGLYRCAQEGVTNILKHSRADRAVLKLELGPELAVLEIGDDGVGFEVGQKSESDGGTGRYGLRGLRHRLELVRGIFTVKSVSGEGTRLIASVPRDPVKIIGETE